MNWKERMDGTRKSYQDQIKEVKKILKRKTTTTSEVHRLAAKIDRLGHEADRYNSSKVNPVRLENGAVINMKTFTSFVKKFKLHDSYEVKITDEDVQIVYSTRYGKGRLILADMRERFVGWELPEATL